MFNRWREIIFESYAPNYNWDGTYEGELVQSGVTSIHFICRF
ncbi:hypothetical protein DNU06_15930 [Putridiphycobacter roseus]|uniref:Uncharacterized protein n=1 Tax=Putridiphycobacter roseus TaxID=2219161 RepID=A0A2W1MZ85_9FLAO|nr:hypothetical protein DNU06_15930 [Putridiphycobacter roseus]